VRVECLGAVDSSAAFPVVVVESVDVIVMPKRRITLTRKVKRKKGLDWIGDH